MVDCMLNWSIETDKYNYSYPWLTLLDSSLVQQRVDDVSDHPEIDRYVDRPLLQ